MNIKFVESEAFIDPVKTDSAFCLALPCCRKVRILSCYGWSGLEGRNDVKLESTKMHLCHFFSTSRSFFDENRDILTNER